MGASSILQTLQKRNPLQVLRLSNIITADAGGATRFLILHVIFGGAGEDRLLTRAARIEGAVRIAGAGHITTSSGS